MLNQRRGLSYKILIALLVVLIFAFFFQNKKNNNTSIESNEVEIVSTHEITEGSIQNNPSESVIADSEKEIQKCLADYSSADTLEILKSKIINFFDLPEAVLDLEEYQLVGPNNENYRILYDIHAPKNEIVRVYTIDAEEMPDAIKKYPASESSLPREQLEGALTLGSLQKKIIKMKSQTSDAIILEYDEVDHQISSLHFVDHKNELTCNDHTCHCKQY